MSDLEDDLERELESELHRVLDPLSAAPVPARRAAPSPQTRTRAVVGGAGAALTMKLLTGAVAVAAAVTVAGAATTGSFNPVDWGQKVTERVQQCKDTLAAGEHGIGDCVSALANTHGQAVASDARHHGQGNGNGSSNAHGNNSNANDHSKDKSKPHPEPTPKGKNSAVDKEPSDPAMHATVTIPPQR